MLGYGRGRMDATNILEPHFVSLANPRGTKL